MLINQKLQHHIKAIVGLGNPGLRYVYTRHNIGFRVVDELAKIYAARWRTLPDMEFTKTQINDASISLVKPQTFMNSSGVVIPYLKKDGVKPEEMLVVHDELELPFGKVALKFGGSAKGHNGLKSIIASVGQDFARLRIGIGRPEHKEQVPDYVLHPFTESNVQVDEMIQQAIELILDVL